MMEDLRVLQDDGSPMLCAGCGGNQWASDVQYVRGKPYHSPGCVPTWNSPEEKFHDALIEALDAIVVEKVAREDEFPGETIVELEKKSRRATRKLYDILCGSITTNARRDG